MCEKCDNFKKPIYEVKSRIDNIDYKSVLEFSKNMFKLELFNRNTDTDYWRLDTYFIEGIEYCPFCGKKIDFDSKEDLKPYEELYLQMERFNLKEITNPYTGLNETFEEVMIKAMEGK